ncbi:MAG: ASPIC/UnbV domain-containing protein [Isosphaeraceae bacterium]
MPVGARVVCHVAGRSQTRWLTSGTSYLSQSDRRLAFGLGRAERVDRLEVRWPSGKHQVWSNLAADRFYTITEADGPAPPRSRAASAR